MPIGARDFIRASILSSQLGQARRFQGGRFIIGAVMTNGRLLRGKMKRTDGEDGLHHCRARTPNKTNMRRYYHTDRTAHPTISRSRTSTLLQYPPPRAYPPQPTPTATSLSPSPSRPLRTTGTSATQPRMSSSTATSRLSPSTRPSTPPSLPPRFLSAFSSPCRGSSSHVLSVPTSSPGSCLSNSSSSTPPTRSISTRILGLCRSCGGGRGVGYLCFGPLSGPRGGSGII